MTKEMKYFITSMALLFLCFTRISAQSYTLKIRGGLSNETLKQKMEIRVSSL